MLSLRPDGMLYFSTRPLLCSETVDWKGLVGHVGLGILFRRFAPQDWVPFKRYTKLYWRNEKRFWFHTILENGFSLILPRIWLDVASVLGENWDVDMDPEHASGYVELIV